MQRSRLAGCQHGAGLIGQRLAQQRAAVGDPRTGQLGFEDRSGVAGAILNGEGQRQRLATLRQAAGESIAIEIARHHVELAILRFR